MTSGSGSPPLSDPTDLNRLAAAHGVAVQGPGGRPVPESTLRLVLEALGVPASTEGEVRLSLATHEAQWRPLPAVVTARAGRGERVMGWVPDGCRATAVVAVRGGGERQATVEIHPELARRAGGDRVVPVTVVLPGDLPVGRHLLTIDFDLSGATAPLLVAPGTLPGLPSGACWGIGGPTGSVPTVAGAERADLADLAELVSWVGADLGGDFVLAPAGDGSPFADPLVIRPGEVPEHARLQDTGRLLLGWEPRVTALRELFAAGRGPRRQRAFDAYCVAGGQALLDHATWLTIADEHGPDPARWPEALRHSGSDEVARLREASADDVNFHRWCQWVADDQRAEVAREAHRVGMGIGLVSALVAPAAATASHAWALGSRPARGVRLGQAPSADLPAGAVSESRPWPPAVLRDLGYAPLFQQLEASTRHAGGLVLARPGEWLRQWWVPEGLPASEGTWVALAHDALLAAVGIAAHSAGAPVMIDLPGVEESAARWLRSWGAHPLVDPSRPEASRWPGEVRCVDLAALAEGGELTVEALSATPSARRRARRLAR